MNKHLLTLFYSLLLAGCCTGDFIIPSITNDLRANAIDVTNLFDIDLDCSTPNPIYSTVGSTPDGGIADCWSTSSNAGDVWFKFVGQPPYGYVSIFIKVGGQEGTQRNSQLVLWDTDGITELGCADHSADDDELYLFYGNLQIGEIYYFSVSVPDNPSKGTFTMCVTTSD
ncbi:MAG: hypothetical protein KF687_06940 [Cyclobacteriaceae bacterium]|nr:hypothetical protein [Cyclobacteriaceae bacterium]